MMQYLKDKIGSSRNYRVFFQNETGNNKILKQVEFKRIFEKNATPILREPTRYVSNPEPYTSVQEILVNSYPEAYVYLMIKFGDLVHDLKSTRGQGKKHKAFKNVIDGNKLNGLEVIRLKIDIQNAKDSGKQMRIPTQTNIQNYKLKPGETARTVFNEFLNHIKWAQPALLAYIKADKKANPQVYLQLEAVLERYYNDEGKLAIELLKVLQNNNIIKVLQKNGNPMNVSKIFERRPRHFFNDKELKKEKKEEIIGYLVDMLSTSSSIALTSKLTIPAIYSWDTAIDKGASQGGATPSGIPRALLLNIITPNPNKQNFIRDFKFDSDARGFRICMKNPDGKNEPKLVLEEFGVFLDEKSQLQQYIVFFDRKTGAPQTPYSFSTGLSADDARLSGDIGLSDADHKTIGDAMIIFRALSRNYIHVTGDRSASGICSFVIACTNEGKNLLSIYEDTNSIVQVSMALDDAFEPTTSLQELKEKIYSALDQKLDESEHPTNRRNYIFRELSIKINAENNIAKLYIIKDKINKGNYLNLINRNIFNLTEKELLKNSISNFVAKYYIKTTKDLNTNITTKKIREMSGDVNEITNLLRILPTKIFEHRRIQNLLKIKYQNLINKYKRSLEERMARDNSGLAGGNTATTAAGGVNMNGVEIETQQQQPQQRTNAVRSTGELRQQGEEPLEVQNMDEGQGSSPLDAAAFGGVNASQWPQPQELRGLVPAARFSELVGAAGQQQAWSDGPFGNGTNDGPNPATAGFKPNNTPALNALIQKAITAHKNKEELQQYIRRIRQMLLNQGPDEGFEYSVDQIKRAINSVSENIITQKGKKRARTEEYVGNLSRPPI